MEPREIGDGSDIGKARVRGGGTGDGSGEEFIPRSAFGTTLHGNTVQDNLKDQRDDSKGSTNSNDNSEKYTRAFRLLSGILVCYTGTTLALRRGVIDAPRSCAALSRDIPKGSRHLRPVHMLLKS